MMRVTSYLISREGDWMKAKAGERRYDLGEFEATK